MRARALRDGVWAFLLKPLSEGELLTAMNSTLGRVERPEEVFRGSRANE
jgi:hypothetical protein